MIGPAEIHASIVTLSIAVASGPDGTIFEMLKHGSEVLLPLLSYVFELIMRGSDAPDVWHTAIITPLYKKLNRLMPVHYRPVVLHSAIAKLFEKVLMACISRVMEWGWEAAER